MRLIFVLALLAIPSLVSATLDPCSSNSKGKCPSTYNCSATKVSTAIQAAECSHNTRTSKTQTFAVFVTDHQYDGNNGYPYGTCSAYTDIGRDRGQRRLLDVLLEWQWHRQRCGNGLHQGPHHGRLRLREL
ncbi:hypothetical protein PI124_g20406 [Phytophthora idaei]|nr:hypothetical protein PI125_g21721 [Phytophthora idaei]KAG3122922.1 hypothetical protein PI126_g23937 [Phytophthora idaei]KAG3234543.1 hypothetical protein PI124_g20406 [Phytophthora idaei]